MVCIVAVINGFVLFATDMHLFVSYAHVNLCHFFSSFWCRGLAAASTCGSSWTFLFTIMSITPFDLCAPVDMVCVIMSCWETDIESLSAVTNLVQ